MRISTDESDLGYPAFLHTLARGQSVRVFLDGQEVMGCSVADEEAGFVTRCVLDADRKAQQDPTDPESIWLETVYGDVRVEIT